MGARSDKFLPLLFHRHDYIWQFPQLASVNKQNYLRDLLPTMCFSKPDKFN